MADKSVRIVIRVDRTPRVREPRCVCCDLPRYSCGRAAIRELRAVDPEFADFVETPEGARI